MVQIFILFTGMLVNAKIKTMNISISKLRQPSNVISKLWIHTHTHGVPCVWAWLLVTNTVSVGPNWSITTWFT